MATCTAPGHPDCTITCSNGCGAIYTEPNGPCSTFCSDSTEALKIPKGSFSIAISDFPASLLHKMLGSALEHRIAKKAESSKKHVSLSLKSTSLTDLLKHIEGQL
jgi:hypothetical protein